MDPKEELSQSERDALLRRELRKTRYLIALAILFGAFCICAATERTNTPAILSGLAFFIVFIGWCGEK